MADRFGRNYRLSIQDNSGTTITISPPISIEFDIQRNILSSANVINFKIYNLGPNIRDRLRKDPFDFGLLRAVRLEAGYGNNLAVLASAHLSTCQSYRTGVDYITEINAFDGGYAFTQSMSSKSYQTGTPINTVLSDLQKDLVNYGVTPGAKADFPGKIDRGNAYTGKTTDLLKELSGNSFYIDNNKSYLMGLNDTIKGRTGVISAATGLLGTPIRRESSLYVDMIFEPMFFIGQKVSLQASREKNYNGTYKVVGVHHSGMISETIAGTAITKVQFFFGSETLKEVDIFGNE